MNKIKVVIAGGPTDRDFDHAELIVTADDGSTPQRFTLLLGESTDCRYGDLVLEVRLRKNRVRLAVDESVDGVAEHLDHVGELLGDALQEPGQVP